MNEHEKSKRVTAVKTRLTCFIGMVILKEQNIDVSSSPNMYIASAQPEVVHSYYILFIDSRLTSGHDIYITNLPPPRNGSNFVPR